MQTSEMITTKMTIAAGIFQGRMEHKRYSPQKYAFMTPKKKDEVRRLCKWWGTGGRGATKKKLVWEKSWKQGFSCSRKRLPRIPRRVPMIKLTCSLIVMRIRNPWLVINSFLPWKNEVAEPTRGKAENNS